MDLPFQYRMMAFTANRSQKLRDALSDKTWTDHRVGDTYTMDGKPEPWKIAYYPLFENPKTGEVYAEPRALVEQPMADKSRGNGNDFREIPLRYITKIIIKKEEVRIPQEIEIKPTSKAKLLKESKIQLPGAYVMENFGVLSLVHLCTYDKHMDDGTVYHDNVVYTSNGIVARTAKLMPFDELVGSTVTHKEYGLQGELRFFCTTDTETHFLPLYRGQEGQPTQWWKRKMKYFVWVKWKMGPKMSIVPGWTNLNDINFDKPLIFTA